MVFSQVISNEYLYKPVPPKCITELSKDSGFESRVGFTMTHWPNGKAFDYEVYFFYFLHEIPFCIRNAQVSFRIVD